MNPEMLRGHRSLRLVLLTLAAVALLPARGETLTIATYNVENYGAADRMTEAGYRKDYPKPEAQKTALRTVIRELNADLLVLQEVGGAAYLEELRRDLRGQGVDYPHAVLADAADPDRHVALLSKVPLRSVTVHRELAFSYLGGTEKVKRGLLEARVSTTAGELTLFGVHLKSRYTDRVDDPRSAQRRLGEAGAVRDAVLQRFPDPAAALFLVLGDFNDDKAGKALQRLCGRGKTTIAELLPVADSRGETWTHVYRKEDSYARVDHILASPGLRARAVVLSARIYDGEGVRAASDHRPVVLTLTLPPEKK